MSPLHTLEQMVVVLIIIAVGFAAYRLKMISDSGLKTLSRLTADVFNPAIIFSSMVIHTEGKRPEFSRGIFAVAALVFLVAILTGWLFARFLSKDRVRRLVYQMMFIFSNLGFIGIPVVTSLLGSEYVFYVAIYIFEYNLLFYTLGIYYLDQMEPSERKAEKGSLWKKVRPMINMGTIACLAALIVFVCGTKVPNVIASPISYLGDAAVPVSLIIIGVSVGREKNLLAIFKDRHMYLFMLMKMIALPAICVVILRFVPMPEKIRQLSMIMMAMPVGTMPLVMLSERGIRSEECSNGIIFTSVVSIVTLPVMAVIYQLIMSI